MPITIGSNISSLRSLRVLGQATERFGSVLERLSSGQRINSASDDAAGLAIAESLNLDKRVFNQGIRNLNDGLSALSIIDQTFGQLTSIVTRQKELAEQAANGVYSDAQREALDTEAQALRNEYNRIIESTEFNSMKLLDGDTGQLRLQGGYGIDGSINTLIRESSEVIIGQEEAGTTSDYSWSMYGNGSPVLDQIVLVGDLTNDGRDDIITIKAYNRAPGTARIAIEMKRGQEGGTFGSTILVAGQVVSGIVGPTLANLDARLFDDGGDGDLDLQISAYFEDGFGNATENELFTNLTVQNGGVFSMDTAFNDDPGATVDEGIHSGTVNDVGDFNGDGFLDNISLSGINVTAQITDTIDTTEIQLEDLRQEAFELTNRALSLQAIDDLTELLDELGRRRGEIGASQSRIEVGLNVLRASSENYASAASRILDADVAEETANLTRLQIIQESSAAILAQANLQPELALTLLSFK